MRKTLESPAWSWFYTAPIEDGAIRRGDPLGMRGLAENFAEHLAPGLSNRVVDARWITILSWCLQQGHSAWRVFGQQGRDGIFTPAAARDLYTWIRPLEALWLARTVELDGKLSGRGRQLPGVLSVRRWLKRNTSLQRFGFAASSYDRYRFTGVYGAYRVAFRTLPGLTIAGDGWRIGPKAQELAEIVQPQISATKAHRPQTGKRPVPEAYWRKAFHWRAGVPSLVPTTLGNPKSLPANERKPLRTVIFGPYKKDEHPSWAAERRTKVVEIAAASNKRNEVDLLEAVAARLSAAEPMLKPLPAFCGVANSGVAAMNAVWEAIAATMETTPRPTISDVVSDPMVTEKFDWLSEASKRWMTESKHLGLEFDTPTALCSAFLRARKDTRRQLLALESHHRRYGGGRKWIGISDDSVFPLSPLRGGRTNFYRFRMEALTRLAVQCGVIDAMPEVYVPALDEEATDLT